jgi:hypothetical protein
LKVTSAEVTQINRITGQATSGKISPKDQGQIKLETKAKFKRMEKPTATKSEEVLPRYQSPGRPGQPQRISGPLFMGVLRIPFQKDTT